MPDAERDVADMRDVRGKGALGDVRQNTLFLRLVAEINDRLHGVKIRRPDNARSRARLADFTNAGQISGVGQRRPVIGFRHEHGVQAQRINVRDIVPGKVARLIVGGGARRDFVPRQRPDAVEQNGLIPGQGYGIVEVFENFHNV